MTHESLVGPKSLCKKPWPPAPRITALFPRLRFPTISHDFPAFPTISRPPRGAANRMSAHSHPFSVGLGEVLCGECLGASVGLGGMLGIVRVAGPASGTESPWLLRCEDVVVKSQTFSLRFSPHASAGRGVGNAG